MPAGKWEAATTVVDGKFYLFAGYEGPGPVEQAGSTSSIRRR